MSRPKKHIVRWTHVNATIGLSICLALAIVACRDKRENEDPGRPENVSDAVSVTEVAGEDNGVAGNSEAATAPETTSSESGGSGGEVEAITIQAVPQPGVTVPHRNF